MPEVVTAAAPAPRASALVVGLEKYPGLSTEADLLGAARSAARYALWLLESGACLPSRLTLMIAYDPADYASEPDSPADIITKIRSFDGGAGEAVVIEDGRGATDDIRNWVDGPTFPAKGDAYFYFFWAGHGYVYDAVLDPRVCLLGIDAKSTVLHHVEFGNLLKIVGSVAPKVHAVAVVNACRAPVPPGWEHRLESGCQRLTLPQGRPGAPKNAGPKDLSVVYAAARGFTTKQTGGSDTTFADALLDLLEPLPRAELPPTGQPLAIFDLLGDRVRSIGENSRWVADGASGPVFYFSHGSHPSVLYRPVAHSQLRQEEWESLLRTVRKIDQRRGQGRVTSPALLGAFFAASGLRHSGLADISGRPEELTSVEQLVTVLYDQPSGSGSRIALVVACDYIANLPKVDSHPELAKWCRDWASADDRANGWLVLNAVRRQRPARLPDACYVSVLVQPSPTAGDAASSRGMYNIRTLLWAFGAVEMAPERSPVEEDGIVQAIVSQIAWAKNAGRAMPTKWSETIVELVLPRELLGRRLEYEGGMPFGYELPVVIRDLERLNQTNLSTSAERADGILQRMAEFKPSKNDKWSKKMEWVKCDTPDRRDAVIRAIEAGRAFGLVLEHGRNGKPDSIGASLPLELEESVASGAAIVLSVHHVDEEPCGMCVSWQKGDVSNGEHSCSMDVRIRRSFKRKLDNHIDESKGGLWDLPIILFKLRKGLKGQRIMVGLLIEDNSRLWAGLEGMASGALVSGSRQAGA
ncbi:MAG TPA: hypothetical protein VH478_10950 [Trebonia sp.]|nr:hypothetical protein [Trebonia sp.]